MFVFADDASIPVFRSNLRLIAENIYDVTALSPKLFIFNDEISNYANTVLNFIKINLKNKIF